MISDESNSFVLQEEGPPGCDNCFLYPQVPGFLSIIIPVYKDADGLETTLRSIHAQTIDPAAFEVLVANDGADREISELCAEMTVKELVLPRNRGSYAARNKALQHSTGEFIAFVDADVKLDPDWAAAGVASLRTNDLAAGRTVIDISKRRTVIELYLYCFAYPNQRHVERLHMAQTVNLFSRREVFSQIGFFDERLRSGGDLEWTLRATSNGKKQLAYPDHAVAHHPARSYRQILGSRKRILYGQLAALEMHPDKAGAMCRATNAPYRLLLPPLDGNEGLLRIRTQTSGKASQRDVSHWRSVAD